MKRKKFIKTLATYGINRNAANEMAYVARTRSWPYDYALEHFKRLYEEICRQYLDSIGMPAGSTVPLWLSPYAGLCAVADGAPVMGYDPSNGKDFACIAAGYRKNDNVTVLATVHYVKGVAGND